VFSRENVRNQTFTTKRLLCCAFDSNHLSEEENFLPEEPEYLLVRVVERPVSESLPGSLPEHPTQRESFVKVAE